MTIREQQIFAIEAQNMILPSQARGARAMLKLTVAELARRAEVASNTIVRFEADKNVHTATVNAIERALEAAGVEFLPDGAVRLREREQ